MVKLVLLLLITINVKANDSCEMSRSRVLYSLEYEKWNLIKAKKEGKLVYFMFLNSQMYSILSDSFHLVKNEGEYIELMNKFSNLKDTFKLVKKIKYVGGGSDYGGIVYQIQSKIDTTVLKKYFEYYQNTYYRLKGGSTVKKFKYYNHIFQILLSKSFKVRVLSGNGLPLLYKLSDCS